MRKRGRPLEPGNTYRPAGSRNKSALLIEQLLDEYKGPLMRKSVMMGLQGCVPILKTLLPPLLAGYRGSPTKLGRLPTRIVEELSKASAIVIKQAAAGNIHSPTRQFPGSANAFSAVNCGPIPCRSGVFIRA
jgi:hypothetical protein